MSKDVKWILEKDIFKENLQLFQDEIVAQGMEYKIVNYIPFSRSDFKDTFDPNACVMTYATLNLVREVQRGTEWVPGAWCNLRHLDCVYYYTKLGKFLLNDKYFMVPFGDLLRQKEFLYESLSNNGCLFLRPTSGFKTFTGIVLEHKHFDQEIDSYEGHISTENMVIVAEPKNIAQEWRLVIIEKQVITASQYILNDEINHSEEVPQEVIDLGNEIASVWQPDIGFVIDICRTKSDELKLLELNSFSSSGFYKCNIREIVKYASMAAKREWEDYKS